MECGIPTTGRGRAPGFTLVELLVVIAIIAVLAAILFPVFQKAKGKGYQTVCLSNMKQIGYAFLIYEGDTFGVWMPAMTIEPGEPPYNSNMQKPWIGYDYRNTDQADGDMRLPPKNPIHPGLIDPYLKNEEVKRCPSQPSEAQLIYCCNLWSRGLSGPMVPPLSEYGPFSKDYFYLGNLWGTIGAKESEIEQPSYTMVVWEHWEFAPRCNFIQRTKPSWYASPPEPYRGHFEMLHYEGANTLWADGHAKRMLYGQLRRPMFSCRKSIYPDY
jgi:prepilin-type N-terminal cleavage/methylation domain-containing protein/prepilin-type processing-associated H-X9-DG protein